MYSNEDYLLNLLQESGYVAAEDVQVAQSAKGQRTTLEYLLEKGTVNEEVIAQTMAVNSGMEYVDLNGFIPEEPLLATVPPEVATKYTVIPVALEPGRLVLAIADPLDFQAMDSLPHLLREFTLEYYCAPRGQIMQFLVEFYGLKIGGGDMVVGGPGGAAAQADDNDAPIIKLVSEMLNESVINRASDIHIEPLEKRLRIRYRIDGVLQEVASHPKHLHAPIMARLKIMTGSMSIDERRVPQDGRIQAKVGSKAIDLRVSTVPTNHGESVVMRILDKTGLMLGLADLGFLSDDHKTFDELLGLPDGIILITGPTGSGKTTTLYACLNTINKPDKKIITVEDPVEYQLAGINQVPVKEDVGMTFAAALRSMLRQAPNIVMIGEIRDGETANIAINASLTGHLVFSTLHTNDAPSTVARLANMGVKPFLIASAVRAMMAQRLVRKLCAECKQPMDLEEKQLRALGLNASQMSEATIMGPTGCPKCKQKGFRGRMCIVEIFKVDDQARSMINENLSTPQLRKRARELGMRTLREDGIRKVLAGMTTADEVIESTMGDSN